MTQLNFSGCGQRGQDFLIRSIAIVISALALISPAPALATAQTTLGDLLAPIAAHVSSNPAHPLTERRSKLTRAYGDQDAQPIWIDGNGLNAAGHALLAEIANSWRHGLNPANYHLTPIRDALAGDRANDLLRAELLLTDAYLTLAEHYQLGQIDPQSIDRAWTLAPAEIDPLALLHRERNHGQLVSALHALLPTAPAYWALVNELERLELDGEALTAVPTGPAIAPGARHPRIAAVARRLSEAGHYQGPISEHYGEELAAAVRDFQTRNGIEAEGLIGPRTVRAMNRDAQHQLATLVANLERWRWLPRDLGERHLRVNAAAYTLEIHDGAQVTFESRVIVGKAARKTPLLSSAIERLVLNPNWYVPRRIAVRDLLPKIKADPGYLTANGFELKVSWEPDAERVQPDAVDWDAMGPNNFPYYLQQGPGERNALGRIKFLFDNDFAVYLHDTPARALFNRSERMFSSGCVRVEAVVELAEFLLRHHSDTPPETAAEVLESGDRKQLRLAEAMPVHLMYWTAFANADGTLSFRNDAYGHDERLLAALGNFPATPAWQLARADGVAGIQLAAAETAAY